MQLASLLLTTQGRTNPHLCLPLIHSTWLQDPPYWGSRAITHYTQLAATAALCALMLIYPFPNSDPSVYLTFLLLTTQGTTIARLYLPLIQY